MKSKNASFYEGGGVDGSGVTLFGKGGGGRLSDYSAGNCVIHESN